MDIKRTVRLGISTLGGLAVVLVSHSLATAQCALCKSAISGSPDAAKLASNLNLAILVLLIPPVLIFCGIFFAVFKYRKTHGSELSGEHHEESSSAGG